MSKDKRNGPLYSPAVRAFVHGQRKSEVIERQADGHLGGSFLLTPTGMSEINPFKSDKQRAFLAINKPEVAHKFAMHSRKSGKK